MTPGTEIAEAPDASAELAALEGDAARLADKVRGDIGADEIALPLIKLTQALSKEVKDRKAEAGQFVNSVTGRNYGDSFDFVVSGRFKGRFLSEEDSGRVFVAADTDVVPDNWPEKYRGQRFSELIDAEEQYREAVNDGEIPWGSGPPISTTHNFVGYIAGETNVPIRISLMRSSAPAATVINTLLKLFAQPWSNTVKLTAKADKDSKGRDYFRWEVSEGEATSDADKVAAIKLATELEQAKVRLVGDEAEDSNAEKPAKAKGAMSVD